MLKLGYDLTTKIETLTIEGNTVYAIKDKKVLLILKSFTEPMIDPILEIKPNQIVTLDSIFHDSDQLKTNLSLQCNDAQIQLLTI